MKPLSESRLFAWLCIILLAGIVVGISTNAWAGGDDIVQETDVKTIVGNELTGGDNISENAASISGSRSYGVGLGSIDVDIAQCLGSESTGIIVVQWQRLKENPWCMADTLDAKGLHEAAAKVRCSIKAYSGLFLDNQECMTLSTMIPKEMNVERPTAMPESVEDDDEHDREIEALYARLSDLEVKAADAKEAARQAARTAQTQPKANQLGLTDEQRVAISEVFKK